MREAHSPRTLSDETRRNCLTKRNCRSLIPRSSPSPLLHPLPSPPASPLYHAQPPPSHPSFAHFLYSRQIDVRSLWFRVQKFKRLRHFVHVSSDFLSMIFLPKRIVVYRIFFFFSFVGIISRFPSDSVKVFSERSCCFTFNSNSCNSIYQKLEISEHWKSRKCLLEG